MLSENVIRSQRWHTFKRSRKGHVKGRDRQRETESKTERMQERKRENTGY